jgi:signal transduction histidine kinase
VGAVALIVTAADTGIPWRQVLPPLLGVFAVLLLVWLIIAVAFSRSLSRPLRHVSAGLIRVKQGEYDRPVPEEGWSEARSLARRYNEMVAEVARSKQLQRDFVANAAHELKTPVALVVGFARSLSDGTAQRQGALDTAVGYIRTESEHLARAVDQLFALAKLDADVGALMHAPCRPDVLLQQTVARFSEQAMAQGKTIEVECGPDVPVCLWDEDRIASALANLFSNALEHSGSELIRARALHVGPTVVFEVEDWGRGIPAQDLPHIFDRFYRGCGRRGGGHAGLGLALVREIADRHGGTVGLHSRVDAGTRFTLTLPIDALNAAKTAVSPTAEMTA